MPGGRPKKYSKTFIKNIARRFQEYIENTELPIIARFAADNGLYKGWFYDYDEFSNLLKEATTKKEAALQEKGFAGEINVPMAIFALKQLGWSDKVDHEHSGDVKITGFEINIINPDETKD